LPILVRSGHLGGALAIGVMAAATAATVTTSALAATPNQQTTDQSALAGPAADNTSTLTLITGDTVTVDGTDLTVGQQGSDGYRGYRDAAGDDHLIPAIAQPFVGRLLDPALFDVSALIRDGLADNGRIPVSLAYTAGSTPTAPDDITLTSTKGSTASGYLTPGSAGAFAAALRRAIASDIAAGRPAGTTAPRTGLTGISLAAAGSAPVASPDYAPFGLHITETDHAGTPATDMSP
jgi:hypothetical protein